MTPMRIVCEKHEEEEELAVRIIYKIVPFTSVIIEQVCAILMKPRGLLLSAKLRQLTSVRPKLRNITR